MMMMMMMMAGMMMMMIIIIIITYALFCIAYLYMHKTNATLITATNDHHHWSTSICIICVYYCQLFIIMNFTVFYYDCMMISIITIALVINTKPHQLSVSFL